MTSMTVGKTSNESPVRLGVNIRMGKISPQKQYDLSQTPEAETTRAKTSMI
jgi:hypothetical protein